MRRRALSHAGGGRFRLLQPEVQRALVRSSAALGGLLVAVNLVAAAVSGDARLALAGGEIAVVSGVAALQVWRGRPNMPAIMLLVAFSASFTLHLMPDPHRVAVGVAMASLAGLSSTFVPAPMRWRFHVAMAAAWLAQLAFPAARDLAVGYQAASYVVLASGVAVMQRSLAETRGRYQGLFEHAPVALWEEDFSAVASWLEGLRARGVADLRRYLAERPEKVDRALGLVRVVRVNPAAAELIEVDDPSGLLGRIDPSTFKPETRPSFVEQLCAVWSGAATALTELTGATVTGRPIEAVLQWAAPPGPGGRPDYRRVVISISDVSMLKRIQRELEQAEQRYRLVVQHSSDMLLTVDRRGRIGFTSPAVGSILGYRADDVAELNMVDLVHPDDIGEVLSRAGATPPGESSMSVEARVRRKNGSWCHLEARAANLVDDPDLGAWVVTARDVTERVESRRQLEAAKEAAEAATRAKSELLANVSHEIRTPMNAILGMTDLALGTELSDEQLDYLITVHSSAQALLTIINDLLDLAKVDAGRLDLESVPFSVRSTLEDVMRAMRVRAAQKGVELREEVDESVPECVRGDPGRLRQVLINLIGNAVKFTDLGSVSVSVTSAGGDRVRFDVVDTGIGIAEEDLDEIFKAFEQADSSSTRRHGGTGLGLAISAKLVELMGGEIHAESKPANGSRFCFTARLPAARPAPIGVSCPDVMPGPVLVVADAKARRKLVEMVADAGHAALGVGSSAEVLAVAGSLVAEGQQVGAMVVDLVEPDVGFCRRLASKNAVAGVPMMAIVGAGRRGDGARFRAAGVRAYLTRPLEDTDLRDALRAITVGEAPPEVLVTKHWLREQRRPLRVLVADDSATNRLLATRLLERRGHRVTGAVNGREAISVTGESEFDVVLMDVQMPEVDGLEATEAIRLREQEFGGRLPIVALTAHATASDRHACMAAGMDEYLAKPFGSDELIEVVERAARGIAGVSSGEARACGSPMTDLAGVFLKEYPALVDGIDEAMEEGRLAAVGSLAGRLADGLHAVSAGDAAESAARLRRAARRGDWAEATSVYGVLTGALEWLEPKLATPAGGRRG